jgi:flagellar protein FlaI
VKSRLPCPKYGINSLLNLKSFQKIKNFSSRKKRLRVRSSTLINTKELIIEEKALALDVGKMPIFPFRPKEKQSDLDEIKKLTLGNTPSEAPKEAKPAPKEEKEAVDKPQNELKKDLDAFKEEQRIFTQITSVKEISNEVDYEIPQELQSKSVPKTQNDNPMETQSSKTESEKPKDEGKSAFEKLMSMKNSGIKEDSSKSTLTTTNTKPFVVQEKLEKKIDGNAGTISIKSSLETRQPIIDNNEKQEKKIEEKEANTITQNNAEINPAIIDRFTWESEEKSEEPLDKDFEAALSAESEVFYANKNTEEKKTEEKLTSLRTPIDEIFELLEKYQKADTGEISTYIGVLPATIEQMVKIFEEDGTIEIDYPTSLTKKPILILKNPAITRLSKIPPGEVLETYKIVVDFVPAQISIILNPGEARPIYAIEMPSIGKYTKKFLNFIKDEVAETMPIDLEEIMDPKKSKKLKERFFSELNAHLVKYFPKANNELLNMLSGVLLHEMYGLGDIEIIMGDDMLEEVGINSAKTPITVYHRVHGWLKTNLLPGSEDEINNFSSQIGRKVGREITNLSPILDAHLLSGDRVNATLFPISSEGNTITIRRFARKPWTIVDFIGRAHTMNSEMAAMLWLAMQYEMNIIIAGGTASGKTSALNSLLALVPTYHRILSIEDVREIILPKYLDWNWIPMVTRSPNPEGLGEVTMLDLMVTSLRMRPDRIIVGEIRRKKEAEVLMEAIETGHSIYSTIHANSGYQVLRRLAEPPINIPLMQIELIDLIVVQYRDRKTNKRRTFEIAEIEQTSTGQGLQINTVYKWVPRNDSWEKLNKPTKLITLLNMHTGMTEEEINLEISERKEILEWLKKINLNEIDEIGFIVKLFYSNPAKVKKLAKENASADEVRKLLQQQVEQSEEPQVEKKI